MKLGSSVKEGKLLLKNHISHRLVIIKTKQSVKLVSVNIAELSYLLYFITYLCLD